MSGMSADTAARRKRRSREWLSLRERERRRSALTVTGRPDAFALLRSKKRKTSRDKTGPRDRQFASERRQIERPEPIEFRQLREQHALRLEQEAKQQVVETNFRAGANLDKQTCAFTDQANYDFNLRKVQAENAVQILTKRTSSTRSKTQDVEEPIHVEQAHEADARTARR